MRREDRVAEQLRLGEDIDAARLRQAWRNVVQALLPKVAPSSRRYLEEMTPVGIEGDVVRLQLDSAFGRNWVQQRFQRDLQEGLSQQLGFAVVVQLVGADAVSEPPPPPVAAPVAPTARSAPPLPRPQFNPSFTFESFVVGATNRLAHAAAVAVAQGNTRRYNPLFLYSPPGLGKTHLMHAIGQAFLQRIPNACIMYLSGEEFVRGYVQAMRQQKADEFRERYRAVQLWLVDDVQFIAGKERTQEEFFHIFNMLHGAGKQLVLSSDKAPRELIGVEERLRSRFEMGLCADIAPPDLETRIAILLNKAARDGVELPLEVAEFIADKVQSNVRVLEGVLTRLIAQSSLAGEPLTLTLAAQALQAYLVNAQPQPVQTPSLERIVRVVCDELGVSQEELLGSSRRSEVVQARQIAAFLAREATGESWQRIAQALGRADHTTVLHAYKQAEQRTAPRRPPARARPTPAPARGLTLPVRTQHLDGNRRLDVRFPANRYRVRARRLDGFQQVNRALVDADAVLLLDGFGNRIGGHRAEQLGGVGRGASLNRDGLPVEFRGGVARGLAELLGALFAHALALLLHLQVAFRGGHCPALRNQVVACVAACHLFNIACFAQVGHIAHQE
jgi:chromosomal replication initiator protein